MAAGQAPRERVDLRRPDEAEIAVRVGRCWREMRRGAAMGSLRAHLFGDGGTSLEAGQVDALDALVHHPDWRMSQVADALRVDPSTATRCVERLVNAGLARRDIDGTDRRVVRVGITPEGHRMMACIEASRREVFSRLLAEFDRAEREQLADLLERFVCSLDTVARDLTAAL